MAKRIGTTPKPFVPMEHISQSILFVRGQKVILDFVLAEMYGVATKTLNEAIRRKRDRFPSYFMFIL